MLFETYSYEHINEVNFLRVSKSKVKEQFLKLSY